MLSIALNNIDSTLQLFLEAAESIEVTLTPFPPCVPDVIVFYCSLREAQTSGLRLPHQSVSPSKLQRKLVELQQGLAWPCPEHGFGAGLLVPPWDK